MTLETPSKSLIVFVRLRFGKKKGVDGVSGPQRKIGIRYESDLKVTLEDSRCKQRFLQPFLIDFQATIKFLIVSIRLMFPKVGDDGFTGL